MDETGAYYTEWSKSQRKTPIHYINAYIWNLERWLQWPFMWNNKTDTDIKNRLLDSVGEVNGGMISENSFEICMYMWNRWPVQVRCIKQGTLIWCTGTTQRDRMGKEVGGGSVTAGHMYTRGWFMSMFGKHHHNIVK